MVRLENQRFIESEHSESCSFWMSRLVLGSETGVVFSEKEQVLAFHFDNDTPSEVKTIDIATNPETDFLELSFGMEGNNEEFVLSMTAGLSLRALHESGFDRDDLVYRGGRLVCTEQFEFDSEWDDTADLGDIRYSAGDNLYLVYSDMSEMMTDYSTI